MKNQKPSIAPRKENPARVSASALAAQEQAERHDRLLRVAAVGRHYDWARSPAAKILRDMSREPPDRCQSGYSSFRQVRGSAGWAFGVRSSKALKYGATTDREGNSESVQSRATVGTQSLQLVTKLYA